VAGDAGDSALDAALPVMYLQPVVDLATGDTVAAEALARFPDTPELAPGPVFARERAAGGGVALEAACVRAARAKLRELPAGVDLAVNVSPDALEHPLVRAALAGDLHRVILEVTEQPAADPARLADSVAELRSRGARLAVDDVTTGHAGLMRLAELRPDIIKIDRGAVRAIAGGTEQIAVVEALVSLGRRLGCLVLAEGVESLADLPTLAGLDVDLAQGWAIAVPSASFAPVSELVRASCLAARRTLLSLSPAAPHPAGGLDLHHVTAELAGLTQRADLDRALTSAAQALGVDMINVSVVDDARVLREVIATPSGADETLYRLADYPATVAALRDGVMLEVQVGRPGADPAEEAVLTRLGMAGLLLVPLVSGPRRIGVLEMYVRRTRRWTGRDLQHARILAQHVIYALARIEPDG
jgi:EAL domain-containing protein (putative c-di-GMP-specific phosphodiesterase class I)